MNENSDEQDVIREYLLGTLRDEAKMRRVETNLLHDDRFNEQFSVAEDELVDQYLDDSLSETERERFLQFFLISRERKEKLRLIRDLRKYAGSQADIAAATVAAVADEGGKESSAGKKPFFNWRGLFAQPAFRFAALAVVVCGLGFAVWRVAIYQSAVDAGLAQLDKAYQKQRPTESRTTINYDYAPFPETRGPKDAPSVAVTDDTALRLAQVRLSEAAQNQNDAAAQHALGLLYLTEGNFDKASIRFEHALKLAPENAKLHSDTGALYLEKAKLAREEEKGEEVMENLALALKHINRALEIDSSLLEPLFNKALVLRMMNLPGQEQTAWEEYLKKDSDSKWGNEAQRNLELLRRQSRAPKDKSQILQDFLDAFRRKDNDKAWRIASQTKELIESVMIQQQLAQRFLEADRESRKEEADEIFSAFVYLGELEKEKAGDVYFSELAGYYKNTDAAQRQKLFAAHRKLQDGHKLIKDTNFEEAAKALENAKSLFLEAGDSWEAKIAEYQIYYILSRTDNIKESNEKMLALANFAEQKRYKWLQVLADGWVGATYFLIGESSKALFYDEKALNLAQEISDNYNTHRILVQIMEIYRVLGDSRKALSYTFRNLVLPDSYHTFPRQKWRDLNYATEILHRFKFQAAAVAFGKEAVDFAQNEVKDNWMRRTSHRNLALIYGDLKKFPEAFEQVDLTLQLSREFLNEALKKRLVANSFQILADLQRQTDQCPAAIENYNRAIQTYQTMEFEVFKYDSLKGRLFCNINQKNDAAVKEEFHALLQMFDNDRKKIEEEEDRHTFFDAEQSVYDAAINYAYTNLKDSEQAFNYAENSRARSLLNLLRGGSELSRPLSLPEIQAQIPPDVQMIYYAVLTDKILIWQISAARFDVVESRIQSAELGEKAQEYSKLLTEKGDDEKIKQAAKELYKILIQPIENALEENKPLCIVADKMLYRIAFSSLLSPKTDKYLVEDYALLYAPSATVFTGKTEIARQKESIQSEAILSIGNPTFSQKEYPKLKKLPAARREAEEIAQFYDLPTRKVLVEKDAVKEQVVTNLNESDVVNFAGHYVPNSKSPALSKLLLASSDLTIEEIMQKKLSRPRLMILSACDTGVEKFYNGEGMIGAARTFLASGVPLVVASQWSVDSEATAELVIKLHRYRKLRGLTTIAALRQAQIDMLRNEKSQFRQPYFWAGFLPVGGYANY